MSKDYVVVTCISSFRQRYVIPREALDEFADLQYNNGFANKFENVASQLVENEEVNEFSQKWLGEKIIDITEMNEEDLLSLYDNDNDYLKGWTKEKKLQNVKNWKVQKD